MNEFFDVSRAVTVEIPQRTERVWSNSVMGHVDQPQRFLGAAMKKHSTEDFVSVNTYR